ncbi:MAG TPA: sensor histidine kinase [Chryseosolibacter sp.]|nr:sensor histidine kinase [Chryseosolibacter sp.]
MNRIKRIFTVIHIVLWTLFSLLVGLQMATDRDPHWLATTVGFIVTCLFVFYGHFYLLTHFSGKRKKRAYFLRLSAIIVTVPFLFMMLHKRPDGWDPVLGSMALLFIAPVFLFLSWLARVTENLVLNTVEKEQLEKQAVEAELYYLKSQINPHFLFNTLNNIHTLVYKQAATAPEAVLRLASLMRYMIYESNAHTVPLSKELDYLHDYIGLQQLRYKNSPVVDMKITGDTDACYIAPLLFIHFLENAYEHSPGRLEPGDILVKIHVKENTLIFICQNPVAPKQETSLDEPGGIGLPNIRKRLQLLYPDTHTLEITDAGERYAVTLGIHDLHLQFHERKDHLLYHR